MDISQTHDDIIDAAAEVTSRQPKNGAGASAKPDSRQADEEGNPRAINYAREHIATGRIRAQNELKLAFPVVGKRRLQRFEDFDAVGIFGRQLRREQGAERN